LRLPFGLLVVFKDTQELATGKFAYFNYSCIFKIDKRCPFLSSSPPSPRAACLLTACLCPLLLLLFCFFFFSYVVVVLAHARRLAMWSKYNRAVIVSVAVVAFHQQQLPLHLMLHALLLSLSKHIFNMVMYRCGSGLGHSLSLSLSISHSLSLSLPSLSVSLSLSLVIGKWHCMG